VYKYVLRRVAMMLLVLLGVTFVVFFIVDKTPGNPAAIILGNAATPESLARLEEEMGLGDPLIVRYFRYIFDVLRGDFGMSYKTRLSVGAQIAEKLPNTILLSFGGMVVAVLIGIPVGIICAKKQYSIFDNVAMFFALLGTSAPAFWMGLMLIIVFALTLGWFPSAGMGQGFGGGLRSLVLPAITAGASCGSVIARMTRSSMLEILGADYVSTARAKGISEYTITIRHMLKNALIPVITVIGLQFGILLGGAVMTETVFAWPGLGRYLLDAVKSKDTPAILGSVIVISIMLSTVNLLVDILYAYIDPRIKSQYKAAGGK
jgi:peptide/nickel transport system permease protein